MRLTDEQLARVREVDRFADDYMGHQIAHWKPFNELLTDWWKALDFWFARSFYRGRSDNLSTVFKDAAISILRLRLDPPSARLLEALTPSDFLPGSRLDTELRDAGVRHHGDRAMVLSTLELLTGLEHHNVVRWSLDEIKAGRLEQLYQRLRAVPWIGNKLATFYLRDLALTFDLGPYVTGHLARLQPIDVWVRKVTIDLGISGRGRSDQAMKEDIIEACELAGTDPNRYNAGAFIAGSSRRFPFLHLDQPVSSTAAGDADTRGTQPAPSSSSRTLAHAGEPELRAMLEARRADYQRILAMRKRDGWTNEVRAEYANHKTNFVEPYRRACRSRGVSEHK